MSILNTTLAIRHITILNRVTIHSYPLYHTHIIIKRTHNRMHELMPAQPRNNSHRSETSQQLSSDHMIDPVRYQHKYEKYLFYV